MIGYAHFRKSGDEGYLSYIAVKKEYRSRGAGRDLITSIFQNNIKTLSIYVRNSNEKAIAFYKNMRDKFMVTKEDGYAFTYPNGDKALQYELSLLSR